MLHIGAQSYYSDVRAKLARCNAIVFEGVSSLRVRLLTMSYSIVARRRRLGLVTQDSALRLRDLPVELIHGDVAAEQFADGWSRIPWYYRAAIYIAAPLFGIYLYLTATRRSIGRNLSKDDLPPPAKKS